MGEARSPQVAIVILAAGLSTRMAPRNKLLIPDAGGVPMITRVVQAAIASRAAETVLVTGHQAEAVAAAVPACQLLRIIHAPHYAAGLAETLKAGILALNPATEAALICLGDMPLVSTTLIDRLIDAFTAPNGHAAVVPTCRGRPGNPVLWARIAFPAITALHGDQGAKSLLRRFQPDVLEVETDDAAILMDFDTPETLS